MRIADPGLSVAIVWGAYTVRPLRSLRNVSLMAALTAAVFYFAAIMPAFNFYYTAAESGARFGGMASLPWPAESTRDALSYLRRSRVTHAVVWDNATVAVTGARGSVTGVECKSVERVKGDVGDSTFYSQKLIAAGNPMADGIVLDTMLARSIGVTIGDTVQLAWEHHREEPAPKRTARVVCLVRPTAETSGVLFIGSVPKAPRLGVDVFVADDASGEMFDGATTMDVEFLMREQTVDSARARFEEVLSRNTRYTLIWVSLMAYGGYQLWDQIDRVQDRRKRYAVLISMGLEDTRIIRALRREQLVLSLITAPLGCVLGAWALVATTRLYLPFDSLVTVGFYAIGVNLLTAVIVGLRLRGELRRLPVAALLSEV